MVRTGNLLALTIFFKEKCNFLNWNISKLEKCFYICIVKRN